MTAAELREKIRALALQVVGEKSKADDAAEAYDELTKFPELKDIIVMRLIFGMIFLKFINFDTKSQNFKFILIILQSIYLTSGHQLLC